ncbi:MAG: hypothetical protein JWN56_3052 [Sphingobacteriales bacterium]|nr:hypothetical protein [Sphingobacteriales bacterium]
MARVVNPKSHLSILLNDRDEYFIGFGSKTLTNDGVTYGDLLELIKGNINELEVRGIAGPLRENIHGRNVRKQPERKIEVEKHISYTRKDGTKVEYDRIFNIWEKEHIQGPKLKLFTTKSPLGELVLHFGLLKYTDSQVDYYSEKLAMNICNALAGYYELYHPTFIPILKPTSTFSRKVLEKGIGSIKDKLTDIKERLNSGEQLDDAGRSYRFAILQNFKITDIYDGEGGFNEYFQFEFRNDDIVILENLNNGNATYIFKLSEFENRTDFNKTTAREHSAFLARLIHHDVESWEKHLSTYLIPINNKNSN